MTILSDNSLISGTYIDDCISRFYFSTMLGVDSCLSYCEHSVWQIYSGSKGFFDSGSTNTNNLGFVVIVDGKIVHIAIGRSLKTLFDVDPLIKRWLPIIKDIERMTQSSIFKREDYE